MLIPFFKLEKQQTQLVNQVNVKQIVLGQIDLWVKHPDTELTSLVVPLHFFLFLFPMKINGSQPIGARGNT